MVTIDINSSLLFQIANFLILLVVLNYLLYKPIRGILRQRAAKIAQLTSEITTSLEGAKSRQEEMDAHRRGALAQGAQLRQELLAEGRVRERELVAAAAAEGEARLSQVRAEAAAEVRRAREELKGQVRAFGEEMARKVLGRSLS